MIAGELGHQLRKHARGVSTMKHPIYATLRDVYITSSFRTYVPSESIDRNRGLSKFGLPENLIIFLLQTFIDDEISLSTTTTVPNYFYLSSYSFLLKRIIVRRKRNSQKFDVLRELHKYTRKRALNDGDEEIRIFKKNEYSKSQIPNFFLPR